MQFTVLLFISSVIALSAGAHDLDLQAKYPFSAVLLDEGDEYYGLHWNFTRSTESIYFAVNVSTTGWIGFGLSPNGQMPRSDVVIGWVDGGNSYFHDRYAEGRFLPVIDTQSQDWFLLNSEESDGFTVLEFSRNFTSCDPQDLDITATTARVLWSFNELDPSDPTGSDAMFHDQQGTTSLNLLGGQPVRNNIAAEDELFLDITVSNVTIPPASTTYWCQVFRGPEQLRDTVHYINRNSPFITPHARAFVHHIIVTQCPSPLTDEQAETSMPCDDLPQGPVSNCRSGPGYGGWAVGGEDFIFPENIALPVGGTGEDPFIMIEMHYDNPDNTEGVVDSSGMRYYYTTQEPEVLAGSITFGHDVNPSMYVPPNTENFTIVGICSSECTNSYIPEEGIRIFSNFFHTHLAGRGLTLEHYRFNTDCNVWEELEPIEQNLNYDFNYQQSVHLPREHLVLPGDIIVLKCFYGTTGRDTVTVGGEATSEEMCLAFPYYYPWSPNGVLDTCISLPNPQSSFNDFYFTLLETDPAAAQMFANPDTSLDALNSLDWEGNPTLAIALENSVRNSTNIGFCSSSNGDHQIIDVKAPVASCSYQTPDRCTGFEPLSCCERLTAGAPSQMQISVSISFLISLMVAVLTM